MSKKVLVDDEGLTHFTEKIKELLNTKVDISSIGEGLIIDAETGMISIENSGLPSDIQIMTFEDIDALFEEENNNG